MAWRAGNNCRRRFGSWSNGGIGDCETGDTGTVEADEVGAEAGFRPDADEVEGVVHEWESGLSIETVSEKERYFMFLPPTMNYSHNR